ncbi:MAG TPA: low molecular weight protein tyrosine phosphatase family protein [Solimonas sp.]
MSYMKNVLFICSRNRLRSPTAEQVFSSYPGVETSSAGVDHDADNPVTSELLEWADLVFVMEAMHRRKLQKKFRTALNGKRIICLGIPDDFEFMDPALVQLLQSKVPPFLPAAVAR